jgi:hypothetical protein
MFEFYGWAKLRSDTYESTDEAMALLFAGVQSHLQQLRQDGIVAHVDVGVDHFRVFLVAGLRNHLYRPVFDLFEWIAENGPGSYGLLYVWDDEDTHVADYSEVFRVWRLARGELQEMDDPFLSPTIPTIEDPYDPERG